MAILRLTGLLPKEPRQRGSFYCAATYLAYVAVLIAVVRHAVPPERPAGGLHAATRADRGAQAGGGGPVRPICFSVLWM
jgi:hypothetical protein